MAVRAGLGGIVSVPQSGEQLFPPAVNVHVTPALAVSLVTVAVKGTEGPPTRTDENLGAIATVIPGAIVKLNTNWIESRSNDTAVMVAV